MRESRSWTDAPSTGLTQVFMSPEIFARDYANKADIWSIGVMLYW